MTDSILDTNIIIRFLVNDDKDKAISVEKLLKAHDNLYIYDAVISEIVWVLKKIYDRSKEQTISDLSSLVEMPNIKSSKELLLRSFQHWSASNIEFIDAYLLAARELKAMDRIYSFDGPLIKAGNGKVKEP